MKWLAVLGALALVTLAACGSDDEPLATGDGPTGSVEGEYRSVEVTEDGEDRPLVDDSVISLRLEDGALSASAGCNTIGGAFTVADGTLEVTDGLHMTEMGCPTDLMDQDTWLVEFLTAGPTAGVTEDGLVLTTPSTTIRFVDREIAEPDADLVGTTWVVTGFLEGEMAMSAAPPREDGYLRFEENGFVTGHDGCNELGFAEGAAPDEAGSDLGLRYEVDDDRIVFQGETVQTLVGCDDEDYVERFRAVLAGTVTWEIAASNLTLLADDGRGVSYSVED